MPNASLSKFLFIFIFFYLENTVVDFQWSVLEKRMKILMISQTGSRFELTLSGKTATGILHWKSLCGCCISGIHGR